MELPVVFRGTKIGQPTLARIRTLLRKQVFLPRTEIARRVCRMFEWRRHNGELAERACLAFLVKLEEHGYLRLPPSRRAKSGMKVKPPEEPLGGARFRPPSDNTTGLLVRLIDRSERKAWRWLMDSHHYLGVGGWTGQSLLYVAFLDGKPVALLGWSPAALKNGPRDRFVGWDEACKLRHLHLVVNNSRFLMLPEAKGHCLASRVLGANLRRLSTDWEAIHGHPIYLAETFIDGSRFHGTCYRASNWIVLGETSGYSRKGTQWIPNNKPKTVAVYPLHRRAQVYLNGQVDGMCGVQDGEDVVTRSKLDVSKLPLDGKGGLLEALATIKDPRKARGVRYPVHTVVALAMIGILSGARSFVAIHEFVEDLPLDVLVRLGCSYHGAPSEPTIRRVLSSLDAQEFDEKVGAWVSEQVGTLRDQGIAIDGKAVRGSRDKDVPAIHLLSAVLHDEGVVIAQTEVGHKTNEMKCVKPVLDSSNIQGSIVTGDAMFTQKDIAEYLVKKKGADYLLQVKGNQPTLEQDIKDLELNSLPPSGQHI